jgi:hypothetical protein
MSSTLLDALKSGSIDVGKNCVSTLIHQKHEFSKRKATTLVKAGVIGRDPALIEILSFVIDFAQLNICEFVAKAGLFSWLSRLKKFGVTLSGLHIAAKSNNTMFLEEYLKVSPDQLGDDLLKAIEAAIENKAWKSIEKLVSYMT